MTVTADPLEPVRRSGVLAVLRAPSARVAVSAAEALIRGGVTGIEITYSTPDAAAAIRELAAPGRGDVVVGAGTITDPAQADEAARAGAAFLVSPGTRPHLVAAMRDTGRVVMAGALTPTEVMLALELQADVVKVFPAALGGPAYLRALRGPFPQAPLMPTGGVSAENLTEWFRAGAIAVGAGGELCPSADLAAGRFDEIERRGRAFAAALAALRGGAA